MYASVMLPRTSSLKALGLALAEIPRGTCATSLQTMRDGDGGGGGGGTAASARHRLSGNSGTPVAGSPQPMPHHVGAHGQAHGRAGLCAAPL